MKVNKCKINNQDGYVVSFKKEGKRCRKYFHTKKEANAFAEAYGAVGEIERAKLVFTNELIDDVVSALKILPKGRTLTEAVRIAWEYQNVGSIDDCIELFVKTKQAKGVSSSYITHVYGVLNKFKGAFSTFDKATPNKILKFILERGKQKTIFHYKGIISDFFGFCFRKDIIKANPFLKLSQDDFLVAEKKGDIGFLSVEEARRFLDMLEVKYPKYVKFYALGLFAGVRMAECERFENRFIDYDKRQIVFPREIVKGGKKSWIVEDYEPVLWAWLDKYKDFDFKRPSNTLRTSLGRRYNLPHNFARHSFATYHLSLYKNAERTRWITRHDNKETLENHYFGALVEGSVARKYFELMPSDNQILQKD